MEMRDGSALCRDGGIYRASRPYATSLRRAISRRAYRLPTGPSPGRALSCSSAWTPCRRTTQAPRAAPTAPAPTVLTHTGLTGLRPTGLTGLRPTGLRLTALRPTARRPTGLTGLRPTGLTRIEPT